MRQVLFLAVVGCASPARPAPASISREPAPAAPCPVPAAVPAPAPAPVDVHATRRAELVRALADVDRELDAIDAELVAAALVDSASLEQARTLVAARKAALEAATVERIPDEAPRELVRAERELLRVQARVLERSTTLGPNHPEMVALTREVADRRAELQQQLDAERAYVAAWHSALAALPARSKPDRVASARLHALREVLSRGGTTVPTDVPARVRLASDRLRAATARHAALGRELGPRHPDLVAAQAELDAATAEMTAARTSADSELDARIKLPVRGVDGRVISRRAELAETARTLRDEYEQLRR